MSKHWLPVASSRPTIPSPLKATPLAGLTKSTPFWAASWIRPTIRSSPPAPEFIGLEKAKQIALKDAGLDETAQKIVFTREELSRNSGKPCYILEFYTDKCAYSYKVDAVSGEIIGKKTEWFSRQESETVPDTSQNSDSKQRRGN